MNKTDLLPLIKNIAITLGRQLGAGVLQLLTVIIISRVYGPVGNGGYTVALLLPTMMATLLSLGLAPANVYFLASGKYDGNTVWKSTTQITFFISIVGLLFGALVITFFGERWFPGIPQLMLWLALSCFPFILLNGMLSGMFQGLQQFKKFNLILLLQPSCTLLIILFLSISGVEDIAWLISAYSFAAFVTTMVGIKTLLSLLKKPSDNVTANSIPDYSKSALKYGYKAHLSNILAFVNYKADFFLLNFFIGPVEVGLYAISVQLSEKLWLLSQAVSTVILPKLSELSNDEEKRKLMTPLITRWVLFTTVIGAIVLAILADTLIYFFFGPVFLDAVPALLWLIPGITLMSASRVLANDIAARGRPELNMYTSFIVVIVNIIGNLWLIPKLGLIGAAMATTIAYLLNFILRLIVHHHFTKIPFYKNLLPTFDDFILMKTLLIKK